MVQLICINRSIKLKVKLMNKLNILLIGAMLLLASCADEDLKPIITFDDAGKGAYPALIEEGDRQINLFDVAGSAYTYSIEFIDLKGGSLVSEYALDVSFEDKSGEKSAGPNRLRSFSSSEFETNGSGNKAISNITISSGDLLSAFGLSADDLAPGDNFAIDGVVSTTEGQVFRASNSSAAVNGAAFRGHFAWNMPVGCPSSLGGTYDVELVSAWCGNDPSGLGAYTVTLTSTSSGYDVDDFSFGAYNVCYGPTSARPLGNLRIVDVCNDISITGASQWGELYTWSDMSIDGSTWQFTWVNDYGEGGTSKVIRTDGSSWPDLVLSQ